MAATTTDVLDVLIVGAGLSGIDSAYRLTERNPDLKYTVLEQRDQIGGTWDLFRYPGVRSDSDIFTLSFPWYPWKGNRTFAQGDEIREYLQSAAAHFGIDKHIDFGVKVITADFDTTTDLWTVQTEVGGKKRTYVSRFLYICAGYYRYDRGYNPEFPEIDKFKGQVVHPQFWPEDLDYKGKKVVVIGSGATAVTLIPSMADDVEKITMLQRSPTYMMPAPSTDPMTTLVLKAMPGKAGHRIIATRNAMITFGQYQFARRFPKLARRTMRRLAMAQLPKGYPVDVDFKPRYEPWDQRLCIIPGGDLYRSIKQGKAEVVTDQIEKFDETGIVLKSGKHLDADIVVTATGLEIVAMGGATLSVDGAEQKPGDHYAYRGYMLNDVPNLAWAVGYTNASWTLRVDLTAQAVAKLIQHMRNKGYTHAFPTTGGEIMEDAPLLELDSGYVQRAAGNLPKASKTQPWVVRHNLVLDAYDARRYDITEGMVFGTVDEKTAVGA
ncbi:NAD(P)/FAD-dependent oxidoreductase [Gordonia sp. X0973]|uniref:flavin-containing monooxygenase n=1 Tax=Gordonia sp. X0973 TaxID=2742602 RepID=UPI000F53A626|nr:NAD(P)/FAD-dependent oxidoreductase [Gordonia sp. X0973]QKT08838.1 NAD(P)/FAD-dependent oxidoreductase [Gordonia sp. X0973]